MGPTRTDPVQRQQRRLWSPVRMAAADSYWIVLIVTLALDGNHHARLARTHRLSPGR